MKELRRGHPSNSQYKDAMKHKRYNIAIIPPEGIAEQAMTLSRALAPYNPLFTLDGKTLFPHISLYHVSLTEEVLDVVVERLEKTLATIHSFPLKQETYYPKEGVWIGVRYVKDKPILDLHSLVIAAVRDLRVPEKSQRYEAEWQELSLAERKEIEYCGWSSAFALYSPHLNFSKLEIPYAGLLAELPVYDFSFEVTEIGLYEIGKQGTCTRLLAALPLVVAPEIQES
ncbi:MAG: hypothetical protein ABI747_04600, partial [Candidatus Moraniibacteriota bacterium]